MFTVSNRESDVKARFSGGRIIGIFALVDQQRPRAIEHRGLFLMRFCSFSVVGMASAIISNPGKRASRLTSQMFATSQADRAFQITRQSIVAVVQCLVELALARIMVTFNKSAMYLGFLTFLGVDLLVWCFPTDIRLPPVSVQRHIVKMGSESCRRSFKKLRPQLPIGEYNR